MVTHYFTLQALARELDAALRGYHLKEIFTQQKNELLILLHRDSDEACLSISIEPSLNYLYLRDAVPRARRNTVDLFAGIAGRTISAVNLDGHDRTVQFKVEEGFTLLARLYNTSASNVYLVDENKTILEAFKHNKDLNGKPFISSPERFEESLLTSAKLFEEHLSEAKNENILVRLKQAIPMFGTTFTREALHRSHIPATIATEDLKDDDVERLLENVNNVFAELEHPIPMIYYDGASPKVLSVIVLQHLSDSRSESFSSASLAVSSFVGQLFRNKKIENERVQLLKKLKHLLDLERHRVGTLQGQLADSGRADDYQHTGTVIMSNLQYLVKGVREAELRDICHEDKTIHVTLDPKLTPAQNAERYFDKAKKCRLSMAESDKRMSEALKRVGRLEKMLPDFENCETAGRLNELRVKHEEDLKILGLGTTRKNEKTLPFRLFTVSGGLEVWVGKSAASNDLLTTEYARPNDLWFHVRGAGGSHTVLRIPDKKTIPSKEAILQAASISAYYSKMRKASNVPVAYTERKYVRKPKKSPEGTVSMERETVVFVEPALP